MFYENNYFVNSVKSSTGFHFCKSFNVVLDSPICFCIQFVAVWHCVRSIWRNLASHKYVLKESILIASDNCGYSSLIHYQNFGMGSFLKVSCSVKSETLSISFVLCYIKIHLICLAVWIVDLWLLRDFIISCIGHLENTGSLNYAVL